MDIVKEVKEYNVLGQIIRLKSSDNVDDISADTIVNFVRSEAEAIKQSSPILDDGQVAVLVALKLAQEKLELEQDFKDNITSLQATAKDALRLVEEVSPTTH